MGARVVPPRAGQRAIGCNGVAELPRTKKAPDRRVAGGPGLDPVEGGLLRAGWLAWVLGLAGVRWLPRIGGLACISGPMRGRSLLAVVGLGDSGHVRAMVRVGRRVVRLRHSRDGGAVRVGGRSV